MSNSNKQAEAKLKEVAGKSVKIENRHELKQLILELTEQRIYEKFSDKNLDRENEKIKLRSGKEIIISEIKLTIAESVSPYYPIFTIETEFYSEMYRLNNWDIDDAKNFYKPPIVGKYTNEIIYQRFSPEVLPILRHLNPYIGNSWLREFKYFQFLTEKAKNELQSFIEESVILMKKCNTWYEFRVKYFIEHNVPYQRRLFENTDKIIDEYLTNRHF
jgi:hypothetical protein